MQVRQLPWSGGAICAGVLGLAVLAACTSSSAVPCGEVTCPPGARCHEDSGKCILAGCGDGVASATEECDPGRSGGAPDLNNRTCDSEGFYRGDIACTEWCELDLTSCGGFCGDGVVDPGEHCDGAPAIDETCTDYGFDVGRMSCTSACSAGFDGCHDVGWRVIGGDRLIPLNALWGASATDIFAVGEFGRVWRGSGSTWQIMTPAPTSEALNGVWGSSATNVFAVGNEGTIVRFDGTSWTKMTVPVTIDLYGVWGRGPNDVYAVGEVTTILHFDGTSWTVERQAAGGASLRAITGTSARIIAVGERPLQGARIYRKELGVASPTWVLDTAPDITPGPTFLYDLMDVWTDGDEFFAVGGESLNGRNVVARFKDSVWTATTQGQYRLDSIVGTSATDVIAGGHTGVLMRYDGFRWRAIFNDSPRTVTGLWGTSTRSVYGTTLSGTIIAPDGFEWSEIKSVNGLSELRGVERLNDGNLIVAGSNGFVAEIVNDQVTQLTLDDPAPPNLMQAIWATSDDLGVGTLYVGSNDSIWTRTGTTALLSKITIPEPTAIASTSQRFVSDIWGASASNLYVTGNTAGANGVPFILRFDGVSTFTNVTPASFAASSNVRFFSVWGTSATDIFVAGTNGLILHSSDGTTFTPMSSGVMGVALRAIWGSGPDDVFVSGDVGTVLHYNGTSWQDAELRSTEVFTTAIGTSANNVFVLGTGGMWHFDGSSWSRQALPTPFNALDASVQGSTITFSGTEGQLLELEQTCQTSETACGDSWDNDCDGAANCADTDCMDTPACDSGGLCFVAATLDCETSTRAETSMSGIARIDQLPCLAMPTSGTEVAFRVAAPTSGEVTITVDGLATEAQLVTMEAAAVSSACSVESCAPAGSSITFAGDGKLHYLLVDAPGGAGSSFTISTSCQ